ncbi:hypothetical protein BJV78DRAFT_210596 [Lactifluus subvellereus]|nr:hypothetical protein BJV78DRAFT_210596 [Lactifluus subvellereus]
MTQSGGCAFNTQPLGKSFRGSSERSPLLARGTSLEDHTEEQPTDRPAVFMATIAHKSRLVHFSCGGDIVRNSPYRSVDPVVQHRYRRLLGDRHVKAHYVGTGINALLASRAEQAFLYLTQVMLSPNHSSFPVRTYFAELSIGWLHDSAEYRAGLRYLQRRHDRGI